ncbi:AAA family ATPase [Sphingomonas endolithica]|uniref:AAA family ATPase n=1 Tax=Sphingomonas endolithica TaxID=2972485 RepID=UPI0021AE5CC5|nr:AAA family ATPase [Sphingomonas sp. ZFBP2030]
MLTGLVVGKFCPLHRGHEALIAFAAARCDRLVILSYTNPDLGYPTAQRAAWLEALFPQAVRLVLGDAVLADFARRTGTPARTLPHNNAPAAQHRAFTFWVCHTILGMSIDRVFTSESYGDGFAAALSRYQSEAAGAEHQVEHLSFDPGRRLNPVSGTALRQGEDGGLSFFSPVVRSSLVRRIGIIGGESSGKTTLARTLADRLGTIWVPEYGRELWERRAGNLRFADMVDIAIEQSAREQAALPIAHRWLPCDTTPLVTAFYSEAMFGSIDPALSALARRPYDLLVVCAPDFAFVQDGTRQDDAFRQRQHDWYLQELDRTGTPYVLMEGDVETRCSRLVSHELPLLAQAV